MNLELFIVLVLVAVFFVSCCGLIQKIRKHEEETGRVISISQVQVSNQTYNNNAYQNSADDLPNGVYPAGIIAPPPYIESELLPPKYEDIIKSSDYAVIQIDPTSDVRVHQYNSSENILTLSTNRPHTY